MGPAGSSGVAAQDSRRPGRRSCGSQGARRPRVWSSCAATPPGRPDRSSSPGCAGWRPRSPPGSPPPAPSPGSRARGSAARSPPSPPAGPAAGPRSGCPMAPSTFGTMITSILSPISRHDLGQVVQHPWRLERVHARPQRRLAHIHLAPHLDQPGAGRLLAVHRHGVLEVAEQNVHRWRDIRHLCNHFLVREVEEVDHSGRLEGDLTRRLGRADREGLVEGSGVAQGFSPGCGRALERAASALIALGASNAIGSDSAVPRAPLTRVQVRSTRHPAPQETHPHP